MDRPRIEEYNDDFKYSNAQDKYIDFQEQSHKADLKEAFYAGSKIPGKQAETVKEYGGAKPMSGYFKDWLIEHHKS